MDVAEFKWAAVVFGMLLGLGITRVLSSVAAAIRSRRTAGMDWVALSWAACVFATQLEQWWAFADFSQIVRQWTFLTFLVLISSPLLLYFTAALILPNHELKPGENHRELFQLHGRWALIFIALYYLLNLLETQYFWRESLLNGWAGLNLLLIVLPVLAFFAHDRVERMIALFNLGLTAVFIFVDISIPIPVD
jgi:hypothetical protein